MDAVRTHSTPLHVRYHETDQMGVVHHANYVNWFELGRTEFMRAHGLDYAEMERRGVLLAVADVGLTYLKPARFGELVTVESRLSSVERVRVLFEYEVKRGADLLCRGHTLLACVGRDLKPQRIPEADRAKMVALASAPLAPRRR